MYAGGSHVPRHRAKVHKLSMVKYVEIAALTGMDCPCRVQHLDFMIPMQLVESVDDKIGITKTLLRLRKQILSPQ